MTGYPLLKINEEEFETRDYINYGLDDDYADIVVYSEFARDIERENVVMREALEFYANLGVNDGGKCAIEALKKI